MLSHTDLKGVMAMMPAFTTDKGGDVDETNTIDVDRLRHGVNRMVTDGANAIATTGSFGEATNLLLSELDTLARATVEVVSAAAQPGGQSIGRRESTRGHRENDGDATVRHSALQDDDFL